jgi:hypothetical protein
MIGWGVYRGLISRRSLLRSGVQGVIDMASWDSHGRESY